MLTADFSILFISWLTVSVLSSAVGWLIGLADWSQLGWAFLGSTAFVAYEKTQDQPKVRTVSQQAIMVGLGILVAMASTKWVSTKFGFPAEMATPALGAAGYKLFGLFQKRVDKPTDAIDDITKLPK